MLDPPNNPTEPQVSQAEEPPTAATEIVAATEVVAGPGEASASPGESEEAKAWRIIRSNPEITVIEKVQTWAGSATVGSGSAAAGSGSADPKPVRLVPKQPKQPDHPPPGYLPSQVPEPKTPPARPVPPPKTPPMKSTSVGSGVPAPKTPPIRQQNKRRQLERKPKQLRSNRYC